MDDDKGKQKKKTRHLVAFTVGRCGDSKENEPKKKKAKKTKKGGGGRLGCVEREIMLSVMGPQAKLNYPLHMLAMSDGTFTQEYEIPEADRESVLRKLYLFRSVPSMETEMLDIHENKKFKVKDFRVIREDHCNFIVSPYYPISGGTLLDWVKCEEKKKETKVIIVANVFRQCDERVSPDEENDDEDEREPQEDDTPESEEPKVDTEEPEADEP